MNRELIEWMLWVIQSAEHFQGKQELAEALRQAIEQAEKQKPVAWMLECQTMTGDTTWYLSWSQSGAVMCNRLKGKEHEKPLYTAPQREWVGLTDEDIAELRREGAHSVSDKDFRAIEVKLKEKNT
jgi:hypothetical protein